jgi:o-succinylbenzoate synthase
LSRRVAESQLQFSYKVYRRSFRIPVRTSHGPWSAREGILVRLEREDGRCGFGEIAPIERFGTETLAGALAWCASLGARADRARVEEIPNGLPCCAAAVAAAMAGLEGTAPADFPPLPVAGLLPAGGAAFETLARAVDAGFTTFKLKIGTGDFSAEHTHVDRIVARLPAKGCVRLDANGGLDAHSATRWLDAAQAWPVEFVEQPLPPAAERDLVRLAEDHGVTVALDESVRSADDIKRWRDHGWRGVFVLKPALAGAPDDWLREVRIAPTQFVFSSGLETGIGAAAGLRLAVAAGTTRALGYGVSAFFDDDGLDGGVAQPTITPGDLTAMNPETIWNHL